MISAATIAADWPHRTLGASPFRRIAAPHSFPL